jgi:hypothetical protein
MATRHSRERSDGHDHGNEHGQARAAAEMAEACRKFLDSLSPEQKAKATYRYEDGERIFWYYPPMNRHGLPIRDMDASQRELAYDIMASTLTEEAYQRAVKIIDLETTLGQLEKEAGTITFARDPELYYFTVFGEPGGQDPWAWRAEGHHVSLHFSVWGDKVISATPFFFGSNPAEVRKGPQKGLRILASREDIAYELMESLDSGQRSKAIIMDKAPWDILTYNSSRVVLPKEEGLPASRMSGIQQEMLMALVTEYVGQARSEIAQQKLDAIREQGVDRLHLAWAGPVERGLNKEHYYRIHGGNFLVEFDNRQNGANHIHSVWRDVENDFAQDVLRQHLLLYHVI